MRKMKVLFLVAVISVFTVMMAACGGSGTASSSAPKTQKLEAAFISV